MSRWQVHLLQLALQQTADRIKLLPVHWLLASRVDVGKGVALVSWHCVFRPLGHLAFGVGFQIQLVELFCEPLDLVHVVL